MEAAHTTEVTAEQRAQFTRIAGTYIKAELEEDRKKGGIEEWEKEKSGQMKTREETRRRLAQELKDQPGTLVKQA